MRIGRLTLHTGPLTDADARELARLVAEDLAGMPLPPAGSVRIDVAQPGTGGLPSLREAVAAALEQALSGSDTREEASGPSRGAGASAGTGMRS
ncbi:hypothetical protein [Microbacterium sp. BK668]|uniref:hypothetical protein n=1 Tax=Microbacterium sp. BK668 TaxID=2512118 RepID=UPI00105B2E46|nr:hypothetical protein [Microbacterium sp. BK668]TDN90905.1 hypothetical protein EV279_0398 [Microbacterium sp. BK668]